MPECDHSFKVMHHYGENGEHYCPTGFLMCHCGEVVNISEEQAIELCSLWGVKPRTEPLDGPGRDDTPWLDSFGNVVLPNWM